MKTITMFHIDECKYCDFARQAITELKEDNPKYRNIETRFQRILPAFMTVSEKKEFM
jgi:glutaredoxin